MGLEGKKVRIETISFTDRDAIGRFHYEGRVVGGHREGDELFIILDTEEMINTKFIRVIKILED